MEVVVEDFVLAEVEEHRSGLAYFHLAQEQKVALSH